MVDGWKERVNILPDKGFYQKEKKNKIALVGSNLLQTLNPDKWSHAFLASKMSSYTTKAVPRVSGVFPLKNKHSCQPQFVML